MSAPPCSQAATALDYVPGRLSGSAALDAAFASDGGYDGDDESRAEAADAYASSAAAASPPTPSQLSLLELARSFLDEAALYSGTDDASGAAVPGVRLMTMHAAKGLEFEAVFVPGERACSVMHSLAPAMSSRRSRRSQETGLVGAP